MRTLDRMTETQPLRQDEITSLFHEFNQPLFFHLSKVQEGPVHMNFLEEPMTVCSYLMFLFLKARGLNIPDFISNCLIEGKI